MMRTIHFRNQQTIQQIPLRRICLAVIVVVAMLTGGTTLLAQSNQESARDERIRRLNEASELVDREPFDKVILDEFNKNAELEIVPLLKTPTKPLPQNGVLVFEFIDNSIDLFEVPWGNVVDYKTFNDLLLDEADKFIREAKYARAYRNLLYIYDSGGGRDARLQDKIRRVLFQDAKANYDAGEFGLALSIFEDVYRRDPNFRAEGFEFRSIDLILDCYDRSLKQLAEQDRFAELYGLLAGVERRYAAASTQLVSRWRQELIRMNQQARNNAEQELAQGNFREARVAARRSINILPGDTASVELFNKIILANPQIFVGVSQPARNPDPNRLEDWASRRVGRLTQRRIIELTGVTDEGGRFEFLNGRFEPVDEMGMRYQFVVDNSRDEFAVPPLTAYELASNLLLRADPKVSFYSPSWAKIVDSIGVSGNVVNLQLKVPHVRPEALMNFPYGDQEDSATAANGPYIIVEQTDELTVFRVNPRYELRPGQQFPELAEWVYGTPSQAVDALIRGDVDVVDRVSAIDLPRLRRMSNIELRSYLVPTVHMLVPNVRNEFVSNPTFRGALAKAINRELILRSMLQGGRQNPGMELLEGPFPIGTDENDYIGYAYDTRVPPILFNELVARVLVQVTIRTRIQYLMKQGHENPDVEIPEIVLAFPAGETASVACTAIASMWQQAGVKTVLRRLPVGETMPDDDEYDFLYVEIAMNEPLAEAEFLFGPKGIVRHLSATTEQTMRRVSMSTSWRSASFNLRQLHRQLINEYAILPLYQMREFYAYRSNVQNIGRNLMYLYQFVDQWHIVPLTEKDFGE